jgi:protein-disulfide isomerase
MTANVILLAIPRWQQLEDRFFLLSQRPPVIRVTDHVWASAGSLGTVIMYSDYECPFCARTFAVIKRVKAEDNFTFVLRHFPLALHAHAQRAAEASECAAEQRRFWEYSTALFEKGNALSDATFEEIASNLELNVVDFSSCLKSHKFTYIVDANRRDGDQMRIRGTPVTYINGRRLEGAFSESILKSELTRGGS